MTISKDREIVYIGVDGCKAGWFAIVLQRETNWQVDVFPDISSLWNQCQHARLILIDIPIGLRNGGFSERLCDKEARELLRPPRGSSVFPAPCRVAVYANSTEASDINKRLTDRKLSKQVLSIIPKIKQVDQLLLVDKNAKSYIREIHPELCFWALNHKKSMTFPKKDERGIQERKEVLTSVYPYCVDIFNYAVEKYLRKEVAKDDILDALVAAVTASKERQGLSTIPDNPKVDSKGLPMEMVYYPMSWPGILPSPKP